VAPRTTVEAGDLGGNGQAIGSQKPCLDRLHPARSSLTPTSFIYKGADLTAAWFDKASQLNYARLTGVRLDQVSFDNTNLAVVDWDLVGILGDELIARISTDADGKAKDGDTRLREYKAAVRSNRLLAKTDDTLLSSFPVDEQVGCTVVQKAPITSQVTEFVRSDARIQ
jgi:hypothetical protein